MEFVKKVLAHLPETPTLCFLITLFGILLIGPTPVTSESEPAYYPPAKELQADDIPMEVKTAALAAFTLESTPGSDDGCDIPAKATSFKAWMPYTAITCKSSKQWALQQNAWTDEAGFRRYGNDGWYMVALGTYYTEQCGKVFDITFEEGTTIRCIVGGIKADQHTDSIHQHHNGNVVEFIVDDKAISKTCKHMGDMSYAEGINLKGKPIEIKEVKE